MLLRAHRDEARFEDSQQFSGEKAGSDESFGHEDVLANEEKIGREDGHGPEHGLHAVRQLRAASVAGIHRDEDAASGVDGAVLSPAKSEGARVARVGDERAEVAQCVEDGAQLRREHGEHLDGDAVELIKAAPHAGRGDAHECEAEDGACHLVGAVVHERSLADVRREILCRLGLAGAGGASGRAAEFDVKRLEERDRDAVRERRRDEAHDASEKFVAERNGDIANFELKGTASVVVDSVPVTLRTVSEFDLTISSRVIIVVIVVVVGRIVIILI